jgi:hypothetical protein
MNPIADSAGELTPAWLTHALRAGGHDFFLGTGVEPDVRGSIEEKLLARISESGKEH